MQKAEEQERAYTELEVNRHIDTSRVESRLQDMSDQASALTDRMQKLEENVIRLVVGEYTARLPSASCCFLLLLVSPARV